MAAAATTDIQCGFCLGKNGALEDLRSLPCSHIHCFTCLVDNYNVNGIVRCPSCREVFNVALDDLPSSKLVPDLSLDCDVCKRKGEQEAAVSYCTTCSEKYCSKHREMHNEFVGAHAMISMDEYKCQAQQFQPRFCAEHKESEYSLGCKVCLLLICNRCITKLENSTCKDGAGHKLMPLDELVAELTSEIDELKVNVTDREDGLSALFKKMSKTISDYDCETTEMIQTLRKRCDEQVEAIQLKYSKLEEELLNLRRNVKSDMAKFMEGDVGVKWSDLGRRQLQIEAVLKRSHQVEMVNGYEEMRKKMKKLISDELPTLELQNMMSLENKGVSRDVELEVVSTKTGFIDLQNRLTSMFPLPKTITLLQTIQMPSECNSVFSHEGVTYVGLNNGTVCRIDERVQSINTFVTTQGTVEDVKVYKDRVYTLEYTDTKFTVFVRDLAGKIITSWGHIDSPCRYYASKLAIVDNQIVIPDRLNKRLSIYSLVGGVIKYVPCPLLSENWVALCTVIKHSVVVSDYSSSQTFKIDISTGEISWKSNIVKSPEGVACHGNRVFVTDRSSKTTVTILDANKGNELSVIEDPVRRSDCDQFDLHISARTLIVPQYDEQKVHFYQLDYGVQHIRRFLLVD